ncbi:hypothetical protein M408DRAFT_27971 [Serendipita vermifera MAFF 305830]|uniref:Uncharacterized protein n=1 Tax=Serendipita vermifera MAFF 305830 TaxID=933852 RepID=A0A0C3AF56_SERVB|nr:hypothetical protein M408DRAFT_27971 [Serendipita vermifera MAFF 305830]
MRDLPLVIRWIMYGLFARTTEEGAKTLVWASLEDKVVPGTYSSSCGFIDPSKFVLSAEGNEIQKKLWKEVGEVVVQVAPETASIWKS